MIAKLFGSSDDQLDGIIKSEKIPPMIKNLVSAVRILGKDAYDTSPIDSDMLKTARDGLQKFVVAIVNKEDPYLITLTYILNSFDAIIANEN